MFRPCRVRAGLIPKVFINQCLTIISFLFEADLTVNSFEQTIQLSENCFVTLEQLKMFYNAV